MRTSIIAILYQRHAAADKMDNTAESFWWPGMYRVVQENEKTAQAAEPQAKISKHKY